MPDAAVRNDSLVALIAENIASANSITELHKRIQSLVTGASKMSGAWVEGARDAIKEGNQSKGMKRGVLAIVAAPRSARARSFVKSEGFRAAVKPEKAQSILEGIIANPTDAILYQNLATYFRRERQPDIAALSYCRALALDRDDEESARSLAAILRDENFLDAGLILTQFFLQGKPNAAWLWVQQGNILSRLERHADAIAAFEKAIALDAKISGLKAAIAREHLAIGHYTSAVDIYRSAVEQDPSDYRSLEALADAYDANDQSAHALLWYRRALALRNNQRIRDKIYRSLLDLGLWDAAAKVLHPDEQGARQGRVWDGEVDDVGALIVNAADNQSDEEVAATTVLGLQLAAIGQSIAIVCPPDIANIIAPVAAKDIRFFAGLDQASERLPGANVIAFSDFDVTLEAMKLISDLKIPPLSGLRKRERTNPPKIGFISHPENQEGVISPKSVSQYLPKGMRITSHKQSARESVERTIPLLDMLDGVVTDDPMTAMLAAATGCPSAFIQIPGRTSSFSVLCSAEVFGPGQSVIRVGDAETEPSIAKKLANLIATNFEVKRHQRGGDVETLPDDVRETILCLEEKTPSLVLSQLEAAILKGGTRNAAYKLGTGKKSFVMRMGRFPVPQEGFYAKESRNMRIAADAGIAPRVWDTDTLDGSMLIDFIDGEVMRTKTLSRMENAVDAAKLLRQVHGLPGFRGSFDILSKIDRNMKKLRENHAELLSGYEASADMMAHIASVLRGHRVPHYATHNDPLTRNFIRASNGKMMLIDWECSAVADPHWEVAALSSQGRFPPDVWQAYMNAYFGDPKHPAACRVALYEAVCRYYWWTDGLVESQKSEDPKQVTKKAFLWRDMYADIVHSEGFKRALAKAEDYKWAPDHSPMAI